MPSNNSRSRRAIRREAALARQETFAGLSLAEKIQRLIDRGQERSKEARALAEQMVK